MAISRKIFTMAATVGLTAVIAGCMSGGPGGGGPPIAAQPTGVEGTWVDQDGIGISILSGGKFQTTAVDTNKVVAEGTYTITSANSVTINAQSLVRGIPISFNCLLDNPNRLNCTNSLNQHSVLTRRTV